MSEAPEDLRDLEQMHQDWLNAPTLSDAMQLPEVREMHAELIYLREMHNLGIAGALWSANHSKDVWRTKADDANMEVSKRK